MLSPFFGRKKSSNASDTTKSTSVPHTYRSSPLSSPTERHTTPPLASSPEKKNKGRFGRERAPKDQRPASPRSSKTFPRVGTRKASFDVYDEHPLNLHPDELRRLSVLAKMSVPRESSDAMEESTPVPEVSSTSPSTNGVNGGTSNHTAEQDKGPAVPPHRAQSSSPAQQSPIEVPKVDAEALKAAGNEFYKAKQYGKAIDEYSKAIEADPSSATYLSNRAAAYMAANMFPQALEDCKTADELEPHSSKILARLAKVYTALGRPNEALETYDAMQPAPAAKDRAAPEAMKTHITQAEESLETGTSGSLVLHALDQAEKGLGYGVSAPRKWKLMRGEAHLKMGHVNSLGEAQSIAMALLRNNNADPEALMLRGRALYGQGDNEKALQHFRQALACDPDYSEAVRYLRMVQKLDRMKEEGNKHFKMSRFQQAIDVYTQALDVDPLNRGTNSKILNNRAMCYSKQKQWKLAIEDCDKAIQMDSSYTKARKTRAKAIGEGGDWEAAVKAYKEIQEQSPEEPGIAKDVRHAELELKKSKRKDYYKILGIEKDASEPEIKRAYKKLAVIHHPDKNIGDPDAENRFKDIQEAHETLIDPQKRERYDSGVDLMEPGEGFGGGHGFGGMGGGGVQIDPEMLFNMMGGGGRGGGFSFGGGGSPFGGGMPGGGQRFGGGRGGGGFPF